MSDVADKLACFQAITGLRDANLCREILCTHDWDLHQAISSVNNPSTTSGTGRATIATGGVRRSGLITAGVACSLGLAWKMIKLPISVTRASLGLASGALGLGLWVAAGVLSYSLSLIGLTISERNRQSSSIPPDFVSDFDSRYGKRHPNFVSGCFSDALQRSSREFKLLFVYLHSPDNPDTPAFCKGTLCSEVVSAFVNENFVPWGDSIRASEGLKMSKTLKASTFPFCAVAMAATDQNFSLLRQFEGPTTSEEMLTELQRILEESGPALDAERLEMEKLRSSTPLREEQDAAYRVSVEADQAKERQRKEDQNQPQREDDASEGAIAKVYEEKALVLGPEPEKGLNVTQVLVRLPNGERRGRRFDCTTTLRSLYDFVDSLGCLEAGSYTLVTFFPRVLYGQDKLSSTLEELGLHPQTSLFVELSP